ncbi:uncharacterized protein [Anabrus simplex]
MNVMDNFLIGSNLDGMGLFDDVYIRIPWEDTFKVFLIQLKHREKPGLISQQQMIKPNGNFSILKYYNSYCSIEDAYNGVKESENRDLLQEIKFENYTFVLYTNSSVEHKSENIKMNDQSAETMLLTGDHSQEIFSFGKKDQRIWRLHSKDRERYQTFLSRFRFYSRQSDVNQLQGLIKSEICKCANVKYNEANELYASLSKLMERWWNTENAFLTSYCPQWNELLTDYLNSKMLRMLEVVQYRFRDDSFQYINRYLTDNSLLNVVIPGVDNYVNCLKFFSKLDSWYPHRYLLMDVDDVFHKMEQVLSLCRKGYCKVLVVSIPALCNVEHLMKSLSSQFCKIILVSESRICTGDNWTYYEDVWTLDQLTPDSQTHILNNTIQFQGEPVSLKDFPIQDIGRNVCGKVLGTLLQGYTLKIGCSLSKIEEIYTSRTLQHDVILKDNCFQEFHQHDLFAISDIPLDHRLSLCRKASNIVILSHSSTKFPQTYDGDHQDVDKFKELCLTSTCKAVHWVIYENGLMIWKESFGSIATPSKYIVPFSDKCTGKYNCIHSKVEEENWTNKLLLITGEPRIGKTTLLRKVARDTKHKLPTSWIVLVSLSKYTKLFNDILDENINIVNIIDILSIAAEVETSTCPVFARKSLKESLDIPSNVTILLDAVDEISPNYFELVVRIIKLLLRTNLSHVWVTSRRNLQIKLKEALSTIPLLLQPFTDDDQLTFLQKYIHKCGVNIHPKIVMDFLKYVKKQWGSAGRHISAVPVYNQMMAEAICQLFPEGTRPENNDVIVRQFKLHHLYELFIKTKRHYYYENNGVDSTNPAFLGSIRRENNYFTDMHTKCALHAIFSKEELRSLAVSEIEFEVKSFLNKVELEMTGVIDCVIKGKAKFVHKSFAEYLVAKWLFKEWKKVSNGIQHADKSLFAGLLKIITNILVKLYLWRWDFKYVKFEVLYEEKYSNVRYFFDGLLSENCELHEAVLSGNTEWVKEALKSGIPVDRVDQSGRLAIHLAASYGQSEVTKLLLAAGSPINLPCGLLGWTPLRFADKMRAWSTVECLLQYGSSISDMPLFIQQVKEQNGGHTLLWAAQEDKYHLTRLLLQLGVTADVKDNGDRTPLILASLSGHAEIVRVLLDNGADINCSDELGFTPLMHAVENCHLNVANLLLARGADRNSNMLLTRAISIGSSAMVEMLLEYNTNIRLH